MISWPFSETKKTQKIQEQFDLSWHEREGYESEKLYGQNWVQNLDPRIGSKSI